MRRREFLAAGGIGAVAGLAGCAGFRLRSAGSGAPPLAENRPDAVYVPTHVEGMKMVGMAKQGPYRCGLGYTYPHRFWLVTGTRREQVFIEKADSVHLMPVVWDAETGIVPPDLNPQVRITREGDSVAQFAPWPMLSQPMGFHFGDNVALGRDGTYQVEVSVGAPSTRRTGSLADGRDGASFGFEWTFERSTLNEIPYRDIPAEKEGTKGAVEPMGMEMMPSTQTPARESLPGTVRGTATSGDAEFVVATLQDAARFGGGEGDFYLVVSPRTPYNRYMLPMMSLSGTLKRGGQTVYDGILRSTIDPDLGYHYGAVVSGVESGDSLEIAVDAPPQTARHEGYETAFVEFSRMTLTL